MVFFAFDFFKKKPQKTTEYENLYDLWLKDCKLRPWKPDSPATQILIKVIKEHSTFYNPESATLIQRNANLLNLNAIYDALEIWLDDIRKNKRKSERVEKVEAYKVAIKSKLIAQRASCIKAGDIVYDNGRSIDIDQTRESAAIQNKPKFSFKMFQWLFYLPIVTFLFDEIFNLADLSSLIS